MTKQLILLEAPPAEKHPRETGGHPKPSRGSTAHPRTPRSAETTPKLPRRPTRSRTAPLGVPPISPPESTSGESDPNEFRIDDRTRTIGRAGIAAARQALADAVERSAVREPSVAA